MWLILSSILMRTAGFGAGARAVVKIFPARRHAGPVGILNQSERRVLELDHRYTVGLGKAILHMGCNRVGHEERPHYFKQSRFLNGLHMAPKMTILVVQ